MIYFTGSPGEKMPQKVFGGLLFFDSHCIYTHQKTLHKIYIEHHFLVNLGNCHLGKRAFIAVHNYQCLAICNYSTHC